MSKFWTSDVGLRHWIIAGFVVVLLAGAILWFANGHGTTYPSSIEDRNKESRRAAEAFKEAIKKRPPVWQNERK